MLTECGGDKKCLEWQTVSEEPAELRRIQGVFNAGRVRFEK